MTVLRWTALLLLVKFSRQSACGDTHSMADCNCKQNLVGWTVDCTGLGLSALPAGIPVNTTRLSARYNNIQSIDGAFEDLTVLIRLQLDSNRIKVNNNRTFKDTRELRDLEMQKLRTELEMVKADVSIARTHRGKIAEKLKSVAAIVTVSLSTAERENSRTVRSRENQPKKSYADMASKVPEVSKV
ncbi:asporin-like [Anneissia japonica]|uniref:asporin-like n=1 Tax=Anneissia japonica TaxID=1529436 RepID=UPI0014254B83|nr:asporin-like [Anneissia japonica]